MNNNNESGLLNQLLDHIIDLKGQISSVNSKLDNIQTSFIEHVNKDNSIQDDLTKRITVLEKHFNRVKWTIAGAMGLAIASFHVLSTWWLGHK